MLEGEVLFAMFPISQTDLFILAIYRKKLKDAVLQLSTPTSV